MAIFVYSKSFEVIVHQLKAVQCALSPMLFNVSHAFQLSSFIRRLLIAFAKFFVVVVVISNNLCVTVATANN